MEVSEEDVAGQVGQIAGVPPEMRPGFDELGAQDPEAEGQESGGGCDGMAAAAGRVGEVDPECGEESDVVKEGEVDKGGEIDGVDGPWLGGPGST